jgi:putative ABC transport system permease protein
VCAFQPPEFAQSATAGDHYSKMKTRQFYRITLYILACDLDSKTAMIKNYLTIALRNIARHWVYSAINIFGLTVGLATCVLIFLWITTELSFDRFHANTERLYRVQTNLVYPNGAVETMAATNANFAAAVKNEIPEVDHIARTAWPEGVLLKNGDKAFTETGIYADSTFFSVLTFPVVAGSRQHPLPNSNSIVITQRVARKLFGEEDPTGKVIRVNQKYDLAVSAVIADVPLTSSVQFDWVCSIDLWIKENPWTSHWLSGGTQTFLTVVEGTDINRVNDKMRDIIKRNCADCLNQPFLYKLSDLHLRGEFKDGKAAGGRIEQVVLLGAVAFLILVIACINFMNLATARSSTRGREVGIRKSIGARPAALIFQFILEALLLSFVALLLALGVVELLLPFFNQVTQSAMQLEFGNWTLTVGILCITIVCGLLAGSYPAIFLSAVRPVSVLKSSVQATPAGGALRRSLVVIQFVASMILIVGSLVIYNQIVFISNKDLGFKKENVIVIDLHPDLAKNITAFKQELAQHPSIKGVAFGGNNVFQIPITTHDPKWPGQQDGQSVLFKVFRCDEDFIPLMGINLVAGRNFSDNNQDASNYIINKKAMEAMGLTPDNVVGSEFEMWNGKGKIIGVTNDFNTGNLHEAIEPLIFMYSHQAGNHYFIRIDKTAKTSEALAHIEQAARKHDPEYPFQFSFLTDVFNSEYKQEGVIGKLALSFTVIALSVSCLGLFGLSLFTAERKVKELGVRKVLGASTMNLITMLCTDIAKLVLLAMAIGVPISWYVSSIYLQNYAFHTQLTIWSFALPAVVIGAVALLTVGYQSHRAASRNPVEALRNE